MKEADAFDLAAQVGDDGIGEGGDAVLFAFAIADGEGFVFKIDVLDAKADAFHEAQAGAVEYLRHEFVDAVHLGDDAHDFLAAKDGGESFGAFGRREEDGFDLFLQDFAVEEENGGKRLVLGGGGDGAFRGKVAEEGLDFGGAHFEGVAFDFGAAQPRVVEEDESPHPVQIGFFCAEGIMFGAQGVAHLVEDFFGHGRLTWGLESV